MNEQDIYEAIGQVDDEVLQRSEKKHRLRRRWWIGAVAAVVVVAVAVGVLLPNGPTVIPTAYALSEAVYPEMAQYPDESESNYDSKYKAWRESQKEQSRDGVYADGLAPFLKSSIAEFLSGAGEENRAYSPLNVYMALAMLTEVTDGESRSQVLELLGSNSIENLRSQASDLWNDHYCNDGATTSILASSLWLDEEISYNQTTLDTLADTYYASTFQGPMGDSAYTQALRDWLNQQTGGLLQDQMEGINLDRETILALATTIYFRAKWDGEFREENTTQDVFHSVTGDQTVDFMNRKTETSYYWGENFGAVGLRLENGAGTMWFLLPDEGVSPEGLLQDTQAMDFLLSGGTWEQSKRMEINVSIPKFDISSQMDLLAGLAALGVTDVTNPDRSDFTPLVAEPMDEAVVLSEVKHGVRVAMDEEGLTAAAYTVISMDTTSAMPPDDTMDFVVDRPFLFAVTDDLGLPLFVGIVNQP